MYMLSDCWNACDAGVQYEHKLNEGLAKADIAFWTEEHLRDKGFFKTPDAKLQVRHCTCSCTVQCMVLCNILCKCCVVTTFLLH